MRYIIAFIISFISFFALQHFNIDNVFINVLVFLIILAIVFYLILHTVVYETKIDKLERFLLKNKRNPNFYMIYALANEIDEDVKAITDLLLKKTQTRVTSSDV
ncbi:hypothetical protein [Litchfieldia alkalitelluris]|uniref:hypothetical protein n=1 Tax=Litchfieldia alkalitelluris TaxID=304268 RepID=UPI000996AEE1|nr:hypothetical protein [Litchfieldia alkalitelluris]